MNLFNLFLSLIFMFSGVSCKNPDVQQKEPSKIVAPAQEQVSNSHYIIPGAHRSDLYLRHLKGKNVGLVINQTSLVGDETLVDFFVRNEINVKKIFAPEHGFRGKADAGQKVDSSIDQKTQLPIISLYGKHKKPSKADYEGLDIIVFDIQDVGARFYTYISTLHYVMQTCAENKVPLFVLDRPNPNGHYIDGPIMEQQHTSFVGMHPVPIVYGMTIGEYAQMINGEGWLGTDLICDLTVVPCENYSHEASYDLPIKPSPNLPNRRSILLYPSLCLFEGTTVSVGRGTDTQFQVIGHPDWVTQTNFTPVSGPGAKYPKHENKKCGGIFLDQLDPKVIKNQNQLNLSFLIQTYQSINMLGSKFFLDNGFFEKLAGTNQLRLQLENNASADEIRASWKPGIEAFKTIRKKYLIYQ